MHVTVRDSLKRLRTDYIDILYVHFWLVSRLCTSALYSRRREYSTSVEEVMRGLHKHVMKGEILYPAVSDTPAWVSSDTRFHMRY
jgi:aryl-alcohol dehydrogenase-like predicted oxidoreductase